MGSNETVDGIHFVLGQELVLMGIGLQEIVGRFAPVRAQIVELLPQDGRAIAVQSLETGIERIGAEQFGPRTANGGDRARQVVHHGNAAIT